LLKKLLEKNPKSRIPVADAINHKWIQEKIKNKTHGETGLIFPEKIKNEEIINYQELMSKAIQKFIKSTRSEKQQIKIENKFNTISSDMPQ